MITYNLTRENMLEYLDQAITQTTAELEQLQLKINNADADFKLTLASVQSGVHFELYNDNTTVINQIVEKAMAEFQERNNPLCPTVFKEDIFIPSIGNYVPFKNTKKYVQETVKQMLNDALNRVSECLISTDKEAYNCYLEKFNLFYRNNELMPDLNQLVSSLGLKGNSLNNLLDQQQNLTCRLSELQKEYTLTEFSSSVTFQLTSECKL